VFGSCFPCCLGVLPCLSPYLPSLVPMTTKHWHLSRINPLLTCPIVSCLPAVDPLCCSPAFNVWIYTLVLGLFCICVSLITCACIWILALCLPCSHNARRHITDVLGRLLTICQHMPF